MKVLSLGGIFVILVSMVWGQIMPPISAAQAEEAVPVMVIIDDSGRTYPPTIIQPDDPEEEQEEVYLDDILLYQFYSEEDVDELADVIYGEARGCSDEQKAAVAWVVLNRVDAWGKTIHDIINEPGAFHSANASDAELIIARDVLNRWSSEKRGFASGRILPAEYLYFTGDGKENHFRVGFNSRDYFEWTIESPYT